MLYLFNVVMGKGEIADPEGSEFACLDAARAEAKQIARDLAAEELQQGRPVEADWRIDVTDQFGRVQAVVRFQSIVLKPRLRLVSPKPVAEHAQAMSDDAAVLDRAQALRQEMHAITAKITATFEEMRAQLAQL
jgi:hypothetical protein